MNDTAVRTRKRRKTETTSLRLTPLERKRLEMETQRTGETIGEVIRRIVFRALPVKDAQPRDNDR